MPTSAFLSPFHGTFGRVSPTKACFSTPVHTMLAPIHSLSPAPTLLRSPQCADVLRRLGAQLDAADKHGRTALHFVAFNGGFRALRWLLSRGADWRLRGVRFPPALFLCATVHVLPTLSPPPLPPLNTYPFPPSRPQQSHGAPLCLRPRQPSLPAAAAQASAALHA